MNLGFFLFPAKFQVYDIIRDQRVSFMMKIKVLQRTTVWTVSEGCWQDQMDFADSGPSHLPWICGGGQRWAQHFIKPGLMALTLAHNLEKSPGG